MEQTAEANRRLASSGKPVFTLAEILAGRPEEELRELSRLAGTEDLVSWLRDPDTLAMLLNALPPADFALFCRAAESPFYREEQVYLPMHTGLIRFALMQPFLVNGELYLVVPAELRALWRDLKASGFAERKGRRDRIDRYAQACTALYGALPVEEFFSVLRERGGEERSADAEALLNSLADGSAYSLADGLLLYPGLEVGSAAPYLAAREGLPPYLPSHEKLLHIGEWDSYDVFRELELWRLELEDVYRRSGAENPEHRAMDCADALYALLREELEDREHSAFFAAWDVPPDEKRLRQIKDRTRLWCLYGNTPLELLELVKKGSLRPGVNRPCPCGSGRKFKRCHGAG